MASSQKPVTVVQERQLMLFGVIFLKLAILIELASKIKVWAEEVRVPGPAIVVCKGDLVTVEVGFRQNVKIFQE